MRSTLTILFVVAAVVLAGLVFWAAYEINLFGWFPKPCEPSEDFCIMAKLPHNVAS